MWIVFVASSLGFAVSARAAESGDEYQRGLQRLQVNQVRMDQALKKLGVPGSSAFVSIKKGNESERNPSFPFQLHSTLAQL